MEKRMVPGEIRFVRHRTMIEADLPATRSLRRVGGWSGGNIRAIRLEHLVQDANPFLIDRPPPCLGAPCLGAPCVGGLEILGHGIDSESLLPYFASRRDPACEGLTVAETGPRDSRWLFFDRLIRCFILACTSERPPHAPDDFRQHDLSHTYRPCPDLDRHDRCDRCRSYLRSRRNARGGSCEPRRSFCTANWSPTRGGTPVA